MEDDDDRKVFLNYEFVDLKFVEEKRYKLMSKYRNRALELTLERKNC